MQGQKGQQDETNIWTDYEPNDRVPTNTHTCHGINLGSSIFFEKLFGFRVTKMEFSAKETVR